MSSVDLSSSQKIVLSALIDLCHESDGPIPSMDLAEEIDRSINGTRMKMQSLINLDLVEGVSGRKGGYKPTKKAYDVFNIEHFDDSVNTTFIHNGEKVKNNVVGDINFINVYDSSLCRAKIHIRGSTRDMHAGDDVIIGPTPLSKLKIFGTIDGKDEISSTLILQVGDMVSPAEEMDE